MNIDYGGKPMYRLPRSFWDDHYDRCADHPGSRRVIAYHGREVIVELDGEALSNLRNDAEHYAGGNVDWAPDGLVPSAKATLARLRAARNDASLADIAVANAEGDRRTDLASQAKLKP